MTQLPGIRPWPRYWACWTRWKRSSPARRAMRPPPRRRRSPARSVTRTWTAPARRWPAPRGGPGPAISVEDPARRHGRKSRSVLFDGYKRHARRDLDTGLVSAVGLTPANVPEAAAAGDIAADLGAAGSHLAELHIGRA